MILNQAKNAFHRLHDWKTSEGMRSYELSPSVSEKSLGIAFQASHHETYNPRSQQDTTLILKKSTNHTETLHFNLLQLNLKLN